MQNPIVPINLTELPSNQRRLNNLQWVASVVIKVWKHAKILYHTLLTPYNLLLLRITIITNSNITIIKILMSI